MKRNIELCQKILEQFEASEKSHVNHGDLDPSSSDQAEVRFHLQLLRDAGAIEVDGTRAASMRLTWQGYDLLEQIRRERRIDLSNIGSQSR